MDEILKQTYYIVLPIIVTALVGYIVWLLKENKKKEKEQEEIRKANSKGTMLILRYMLKRYHTEYMVQGKMSYSQYKDWMDIYHVYSSLGGNSIAKEWNEEIDKLPKCNSLDDMTPFESMIRQSIKDATK